MNTMSFFCKEFLKAYKGTWPRNISPLGYWLDYEPINSAHILLAASREAVKHQAIEFAKHLNANN